MLLGLAGGGVIRELPDRVYAAAPDPKQVLDLYLPPPDSTRASSPPIAVFVHGGVWAMGDRKEVSNVGRALAEAGAVCAVLSYRLAPANQHPAQIEDVAKAVSYLVRNSDAHAAADRRVEGDPRWVYLIGHSAGAQLVSLLALDPRWLQAEGIDPKVIRGVAALSGIFDLEAPFGDPGQDTGKDYIERVFGPPGVTWRDASPINHLARADTAQPFLLVMGERDYAGIRTQTETMRVALADHHIPVEVVDVPGRDHYELVSKIGSPGDSLTAILGRLLAR